MYTHALFKCLACQLVSPRSEHLNVFVQELRGERERRDGRGGEERRDRAREAREMALDNTCY